MAMAMALVFEARFGAQMGDARSILVVQPTATY